MEQNEGILAFLKAGTTGNVQSGWEQNRADAVHLPQKGRRGGEARGAGDSCCPYGCAGFDRTKLTELASMNRIARRVYENISVKCIGSKAGCTWHGKISELKQHRECECAAFKIASSIETCSVVMPRKDPSKHVQNNKIAKKGQ